MNDLDKRYNDNIRDTLSSLLREIDRLKKIIENTALYLDPKYSGEDLVDLAKRVMATK